MAFQATPRGIKVVIEGFQNDVPVVNVFNVDNGAAVVNSDLVAVAGVFSTWMQNYLLDITHQSYIVSQIVVTDISVENGEQFIEATFADSQGHNTGLAAAANAAMVVSWRTAKTGRNYRGRTFVGAMTNADLVDAQHVNVTTAAIYATQFQALLDALTATARALCVLSRYLAGTLRVVGLLTEIISIIVDTKIDSQRRRTAN